MIKGRVRMKWGHVCVKKGCVCVKKGSGNWVIWLGKGKEFDHGKRVGTLKLVVKENAYLVSEGSPYTFFCFNLSMLSEGLRGLPWLC